MHNGLTYLEYLQECSLIRSLDTETEMRFRMLETLREYGLEKRIERGEEQAVRETYAAWCLALVREGEPHLRSVNQQQWLERRLFRK